MLLAVLLIAALRLWSTANRLDRLHVRTEAAWMALDGALARRIAATRVAAAAGAFPPESVEQLRRLTGEADTAGRSRRADAENDLSRALADLPPAGTPDLAAELADAGERIGLARRFYNDAVRDTRALRAVWFTRMFRLAGRAALPDYFEIADPLQSSGERRTAARVVLLTPDRSILLFCSTDPHGQQIWFTPGGGVESGEDLLAAAIRELHEETGLHLEPDQLAGPIWRRFARFVFAGVAYAQTEFYLAALVPSRFAVDTSGFTQTERESITGQRWWSEQELRTAGLVVYPVDLADRLTEAMAAAEQPAVHRPMVEIG